MSAANRFFAWADADTTIDDPAARADFAGRLERTMVEVVDQFQAKGKTLWAERVIAPAARHPGLAEWCLDSAMRDTAGVSGHALCRRTVGLAQVKDLTSIANPARRVRAERDCPSLAEKRILGCGTVTVPSSCVSPS